MKTLTKYQKQMMYWSFYQHDGLYSFVVAVGRGPKGGKVSSGWLYKKGARLLEKAGLFEFVKKDSDKEVSRGNSVSHTVYTFRITDKGREFMATEYNLAREKQA